jgi:gliding motility-associated-like protein
MSPVFQGMTDQLYTITIKDNLGCVTVDTQQVRVYKEVNIYVPKAFTPNNDGLNDYMYPFTVGIKEIKFFRIINRWGVVVYQSKTDLPGWDVKYKGAAQPMDGYVWEIQAIDFFGKSHVRHGSFTLIR